MSLSWPTVEAIFLWLLTELNRKQKRIEELEKIISSHADEHNKEVIEQSKKVWDDRKKEG